MGQIPHSIERISSWR